MKILWTLDLSLSLGSLILGSTTPGPIDMTGYGWSSIVLKLQFVFSICQPTQMGYLPMPHHLDIKPCAHLSIAWALIVLGSSPVRLSYICSKSGYHKCLPLEEYLVIGMCYANNHSLLHPDPPNNTPCGAYQIPSLLGIRYMLINSFPGTLLIRGQRSK